MLPPLCSDWATGAAARAAALALPQSWPLLILANDTSAGSRCSTIACPGVMPRTVSSGALEAPIDAFSFTPDATSCTGPPPSTTVMVIRPGAVVASAAEAMLAESCDFGSREESSAEASGVYHQS